MKLQMHNNKLVAFHIYNKNDYGYLLDQGPINGIQLDDKFICLCSFQQSKWTKVSLKDCAYYCYCTYGICSVHLKTLKIPMGDAY